MTPEAFFETFDQLADVPGAVARLREVILELAVGGRLVPGDPSSASDQPASCSTPSHWRRSVLSKVADCRASAKAPPSAIADTAWVLDLEDIEGTTGRITQFATFAQRRSLSTKAAFEPGDVLYGRLRPYLNKVVVATMPGYCTTEIIPLRPAPFLSPQFLRLFLRSRTFLHYAAEKNYGMKMPRLGTKDLESAEIPLPPLAEQRRIVARVDELMALCDRLEALQQEREQKHAALARAALARFNESPTPANLEFLFHRSYDITPADLRKAILTLAVQGKLVPQDPGDEPAEGVVCRGQAERPRPGLDGVDEPVADAELPWSLPLSWKWVRLGAIANIRHGYAFSSESFTSEPTPYVLTTPGNFHESGGFRDRGANTRYFRGVVPPSFVLNPGDLIIPMTEQAAGLLGSPAFIPDDGKTYVHNQRLGKLEFYSDGVAPGFAFWFFNSGFFRGELARTCTGMKVRHTSPKRILRVPFPLPPLAEQHRIVARVDHLMGLVDQLEAQLAAARAAGETLMATVIAGLTESRAAPDSHPQGRAV